MSAEPIHPPIAVSRAATRTVAVRRDDGTWYAVDRQQTPPPLYDPLSAEERAFLAQLPPISTRHRGEMSYALAAMGALVFVALVIAWLGVFQPWR